MFFIFMRYSGGIGQVKNFRMTNFSTALGPGHQFFLAIAGVLVMG
jgi:hypothetical protein